METQIFFGLSIFVVETGCLVRGRLRAAGEAAAALRRRGGGVGGAPLLGEYERDARRLREEIALLSAQRADMIDRYPHRELHLRLSTKCDLLRISAFSHSCTASLSQSVVRPRISDFRCFILGSEQSVCCRLSHLLCTFQVWLLRVVTPASMFQWI